MFVYYYKILGYMLSPHRCLIWWNKTITIRLLHSELPQTSKNQLKNVFKFLRFPKNFSFFQCRGVTIRVVIHNVEPTTICLNSICSTLSAVEIVECLKFEQIYDIDWSQWNYLTLFCLTKFEIFYVDQGKFEQFL